VRRIALHTAQYYPTGWTILRNCTILVCCNFHGRVS